MITFRRSGDRGHFDHGWLDTFHTFAFGHYDPPEHRGFRALRVINEDRVAGGRGFSPHGHLNMEIFSLVLSGRLRHEDDQGHAATLEPWQLQYMSAGSGIRHSEVNPDPGEPVHFYQVWLEPAKTGQPPRYEQRTVASSEGWQTVASPDGRDRSITIRQDAVLRIGRTSRSLSLENAEDRGCWVQVLSGRGRVEGHDIRAGDGLSQEGAGSLTLEAKGQLCVWAFDLP